MSSTASSPPARDADRLPVPSPLSLRDERVREHRDGGAATADVGDVADSRIRQLLLEGARDTPHGRRGMLETARLTKHFPVERGLRRMVGSIRAVDGVDLRSTTARPLGLVGESGSGKSTFGRLVLRLLEPTAGTIYFDGRDVTERAARQLRMLRREVQIVFQDPHSAFDPTRPGSVRCANRCRRTSTLRAREQRGRPVTDGPRRPERRLLEPISRELSGGQLQRVAVARALAVEPKLLVLDEPVSSLDVSTQAQVVNLLRRSAGELGIAYLFIAHDLAVVRHVSDRIAVMYLGRDRRAGPGRRDRTRAAPPLHAKRCSRRSRRRIPARQRRRSRIVLHGEIPSPAAPPSGCDFHTRCPYAMEVCREVEPPPLVTADGVTVECHLHTSGPLLAGAPLATLRKEHAR